ncbi:hypothetical protein B6U82_00215 [Candidatus Pacearchaeota archaeon ex4484_31]|nr:MAG: hypothetical protein B6U82_00215 [Candidatus Pacearchaeota archaeon ex4484_31]
MVRSLSLETIANSACLLNWKKIPVLEEDIHKKLEEAGITQQAILQKCYEIALAKGLVTIAKDIEEYAKERGVEVRATPKNITKSISRSL